MPNLTTHFQPHAPVGHSRGISESGSWGGERSSLLSSDESHALVSAQACFLPVPRGGVVTFNPVLFNYQSRPQDPAVLSILATPEGTSVTVIDNQRDGFAAGTTWGQRLFFNANGQRASLTGRRLSDVTAAAPQAGTAPAQGPAVGKAEDGGVNVVLLIQVPLRQRPRPVSYGAIGAAGMDVMEMERGISLPPDLEDAVIGHGELEGPFTEVDDLAIERDPRFPVRVTVQFYKATSTGEVSAGELAQIAAQIERVYEDADFTGSLVLDGGGRPTQLSPMPAEPPGWWGTFWDEFEAHSGTSRAVAIFRLRGLMSLDAWTPWDLRRELRRRGYKLK